MTASVASSDVRSRTDANSGNAAKHGTLPGAEGRYGRLAFIHSLRGVAALLVVWAHLGTMWPATQGETSYMNLAMQKLIIFPLQVYQDGGHLGVILFFLISGFIITYTSLREDRFSFAVKRAFRLLPPLAVAMLVTFTYIRFARSLGVEPLSSHDGGAVHWLASFVLLDGWFDIRALHASWTLVVEVTFYVLTFALLARSKARPEAATWAMTGLWVIFCIGISVLPVVSTSDNSTLPPYVAFLLVGRCVYLWSAGLVRPVVAMLNGALALAFFASLTDYLVPGVLSGSTSPYAPPLFTYVYALVIFVGLLVLAPSVTWQPFRFFGDISYSLYLLHMPVGFATFEIASRLGPSLPNDALIVLAVMSSVAAAWISFALVERPTQQLARRLLARRAQSTDRRPVVAED